jgi:hypothetical protein
MMDSPEQPPPRPDVEGPANQEASDADSDTAGPSDEDRDIEELPGYREVQAAFAVMRDELVPPPTPEEEAELDARLRERLLASRATEVTEEDLAATRDRLAQMIREELPDVLRHRRATQADKPQSSND